MATSLPDLDTATAADIFKQPLPTVRQLHRQLHTSLDEKNARLRTLVGSSYRQLLGTAEMIVDMRRDIAVVETKLSTVADGCGMGVVGRRVAGLAKLGAREGHDDAERRLGRTARMKVLNGCVVAIGRLLRGKEAGARTGRRLVTTAKVLVLSRLLVKSLGDDAGEADADAAAVAELKRRLGALRKRLLRTVERTMEGLGGGRDDLVHALCAYSLATSSGAKDVLRHFLHVRGEAMAAALEVEEGLAGKEAMQEAVVRALGLFARTLVDVQGLVPRRLSDALLSLKAGYLLKDDGVRELEGLRLDVCERWFGDEITYFTPYIRHDDLDGPHTVVTLKGWARKASEVLLQGFEGILEGVADFQVVVELRARVFEMWVAEGGKAKGFDSSVLLDGLRKVVNQRMVDLIEARVSKLHLIKPEIEAALAVITSDAGQPQTSLWDAGLLEMELKHGATEFKRAIVEHVHGRNNSVTRVVKSYQTWKRLVDEMATTIDHLKNQRWNDDLDSLEDEEVLEERQRSLSKEDPEMLQSHLRKSLEQAFQTLHNKLEALSAAYEQSEDIGDITIFILRVLRDLRAELPEQTDLSSFGISLVLQLHQALAVKISSEVVPTYTSALRSRKRVPGRALWEGTPELPIYPSPLTFKFLHQTTSAMASVGSDLWSRAAVNVLKGYMCEQLGKGIAESIQSGKVDAPKVNSPENGDEETLDGESGSEDPETQDVSEDESVEAAVARDILVQTLFDTMVLRLCLSVPDALSSGSMYADELQKSLKSQADLPPSSHERLVKAAQEYCKRTSLLLGPLA